MLALALSANVKAQDAVESTFLTLSYHNNQEGSIVKRPVGDMFSFDVPSFSVGLEKHLSDIFNVTGSIATGSVRSHGNTLCDFTGVAFGLKYKFSQSPGLVNGPLKPYFTMGVGATNFRAEVDSEVASELVFSWRPELGLDIALSDKARISFSVAYNANSTEKFRSYGIGLGFSVARKKDSDKDGILDKLDRCPKQPGFSYNQGCPHPDRDDDGVIDAYDLCPNVPGTLNGCPDSDDDGIVDYDDKCPNLHGEGSESGCPATTIAPRLENQFNPEQNALASEVVTDSKELSGITDLDDDKVANEWDACPLLKGNAGNDGCPFFLTELLKESSFRLRSEPAELPENVQLKLDRVARHMYNSQFNLSVFVDYAGDADSKIAVEAGVAVIDYLVKQGIEPKRLNMGTVAYEAVSLNNGLVDVRLAVKK